MLSPETKSAIAASHAELTAIRRDIHAHPELGMEETRTSALVAETLRGWGIETTAGVGRFGVVGIIRGRLPGQRSIGLRADMDALAIPEATGVPYASTNPGIMHACGHDGHTTMLLGAAKYLAEHRDFAGTVNLIFQPAEEGRGGALAML
ncbi:MAG: amidohydrolase, partial [Alphaproteobacteria bacterium]|nr:amidohydrolase [Alphaproteobacteria bacterium]